MNIVYLPMTADLFHVGHLRAIRKCSRIGRVVVGLLSDEVIEAYKGKKPIIPFEQRKEIIEALPEVSKVVRQESLRPNLKGMQYLASGDGFEKDEREAAQEYECQLFSFDYDPDQSTTKIKYLLKNR